MDTVRFGNQQLPLSPSLLPGVEMTRILPPSVPAKEASAVIADALENPVGPRLRDLARGAHSAAVMVPGIDRIAAVKDFALPLLRELDAAGIPRARVKFCLATGTHEHDGVRDLGALLGAEIMQDVEAVIHNCRGGAFTELGVTSRGTPVEFARAVLDAEVKVLTGRVVPHYFAGFGGARKALLPGVASFRTIVANHRLTLAPARGIASGVAPCALAQNPVHLDMLEAARMAKPHFALSTVLDHEQRLVGVFAGEPEASHAEACAFAARVHQVKAAEPYDAVITSAGGAPFDMNFMQSIKAIFNVQEGIREKSPVLWLAECPLGVAKGFLDWANVTDDNAFEDAVRREYNLAGHNSVMLRRLVRRTEVGMVTSLGPELSQKLGLHPLDSLVAGLRWLRERLRPGARVAYVPFGNITHLGLSN